MATVLRLVVKVCQYWWTKHAKVTVNIQSILVILEPYRKDNGIAIAGQNLFTFTASIADFN